MTTAAITILGLGPGSIHDLTLQAQNVLAQAASEQESVYFRTTVHPIVEPLKQALPGLQIESFDHLYEESTDWNTLYRQMAEQICRQALQRPVLYAVPGHPLIEEASVQHLLRMARERGLSTAIVAGISFLEPVCTVLALDPFDDGLQLLDATLLAALRPEEIAGKVLPTIPLLVGQVYNRRLAGQVKIALTECYPDEWLVKLVRAAGVAHDATVIEIPLYELDRENYVDHFSTLYVPPVDALTALRVPETLRYIIMRLRRDPDGCPWDRQQTHQSLKRYVIEETYEVVEALEENDIQKLAEELGDLLLQVYLHAEIARQAGDFAIGDVLEHINAKLIRRHPHIFGDIKVSSAGQVVQNWEEIKRQERARAGADVNNEGILDRVPLASPALLVAQEYVKQSIKVGFAFDAAAGVYAKLNEELVELQQATTAQEQLEELGDILFMVAELGQYLKIDAEEALRFANRKYRQRFQFMEALARQEGRALSSYSNEEWEALWQRAKAQGKESPQGPAGGTG